MLIDKNPLNKLLRIHPEFTIYGCLTPLVGIKSVFRGLSPCTFIVS